MFAPFRSLYRGSNLGGVAYAGGACRISRMEPVRRSAWILCDTGPSWSSVRRTFPDRPRNWSVARSVTVLGNVLDLAMGSRRACARHPSNGVPKGGGRLHSAAWLFGDSAGRWEHLPRLSRILPP